MLFRITGTVVYHTTDNHGVSMDQIIHITPFLIIGGGITGIITVQKAEEQARKIICPFDFQYESVTINVIAETY